MIFTLFLALVISVSPPLMTGRATFYNPSEWAVTKAGRIPIMQNGQIHDSTAFTAAVSRNRWEELAGATLRVCVQPVSCTCELNYSELPNDSRGSAMGCEPIQRRKQNDLPKPVPTYQNSGGPYSAARPCEAMPCGEVLPISRLESCTTQLSLITESKQNSHNLHYTLREYNHAPQCIIVEVTDTGLFGDDHIDLSVVAFRALRPYGTPWDNDGVLEVKIWQMQ